MSTSTLCFQVSCELEAVVEEYCLRNGLTIGEFLEMAMRELVDQLVELRPNTPMAADLTVDEVGDE